LLDRHPMKSAALLAALLLALAPLGASASGGPDPAETGARLAQAGARRARLAAELDELARRIEERKAATRGGGLPDGELIELLQRSQALADEVAAAHREEERARRLHRAALEARLAALEERRKVAAVEEERSAIRRELEALEPRREAQVALPRTPADDPDEAREQADLLRDQRDRVLAQLSQVWGRIEEAREEELLARELRDFVDENDLFDESERVMRAARNAASGDATAGAPEPGRDGDTEADGFGNTPLDPGTAPPAPTPSQTTLRITGSRPLTGAELTGRRIPALEGDESLQELLERAAALEALAEELDRRAAELEQRARALAAPPPR